MQVEWLSASERKKSISSIVVRSPRCPQGEGLATNAHGNILVNSETNMTSIPGVFAGGDIVLGAATVILAMGEGRRASVGINAYLTSGK